MEDSVKLAADTICFEKKESLYKGIYDLPENFNDAAIAFVEGDLSDKGKIEFEQSFNRQLFQQGKAICTFDFFSPNILHNQILKSVLGRLGRMPSLDKKQKKEVWACYYRFSKVDEIDIQLYHFQKVKVHRNNYEVNINCMVL